MKVRGSFALVTGASSGIGRATAITLARAGARQVFVIGRNEGELTKTVMECVMYCPSGGYCLDLSRPEQVHDLSDRVLTDYGLPDIIVNAAGSGRFLTLEQTSLNQAQDMIAMPFMGALYMALQFVPSMRVRGSGHIVNITSPAAIAPWPGATVYAASRGAVRTFTQALRQDMRGTGVGVSLVIPGKTATEYFASNQGSEERIPGISRLVPTLRPEQVALAIIDAIERDRAEVIIPRMLRAFAVLHRLFPGIVQYLVSSTGWSGR